MGKLSEIDLLLSKLEKKQLCEFIQKECVNDKQFKERFLALGAGTIIKVDSSRYTSRVMGLIDKYSGREDYVDYHSASKLSREVGFIIDEADTAMINRQWDVAIAILSGVSKVSEEIINCGDDSYGDLGGIIDTCFDKWYELCDNESLPLEFQKLVFEFSLSNFIKEDLKGWDWWWSWMKIAISLANDSQKQLMIIKQLDDIINKKGDEWSVKYNAKTAKKYKLEIMSKFGTEEETIKFMYDNLDNPDFRKRLIKKNWDDGNYDEVLRLAKDGVTSCSEFSDLVYDWYKWEFKVYRLNNDKENLLRLAEYFFTAEYRFGETEFTMEAMYSLIKSIVDESDWINYVDGLIVRLSAYGKEFCILYIYTQEKMWDRYMEYIRNNPSVYNIDDAPKEVFNLYKDELVQIYSLLVSKYINTASTRNSYCYVVDLLRNLIKNGGRDEAERIIEEQKTRRPRRPALLEELRKVKL